LNKAVKKLLIRVENKGPQDAGKEGNEISLNFTKEKSWKNKEINCETNLRPQVQRATRGPTLKGGGGKKREK